MDHLEALEGFLATTTRRQRYRLAGKTFRFGVYQSIEAVLVASFLLVITLSFADTGGALAAEIGVFVVFLVLGHFLGVALQKPWLPTAAAFEAALVWAAYAWWIAEYFSIPHFGVLCVFLFAFRFWQRGEREVTMAALLALRNH